MAFGLSQDRMRAAIHALKYDRLQPAASKLGRMLAEAIAQLAPEAPSEMLVVPVPLHRSKYAERGFNQPRVPARCAIGFLRKSCPQWKLTLVFSALMRLRPTSSHAGLTQRQRRLNVRAAFSVSNPAEVASKHILRIDDILTTGATARSAGRALVRAGAASVWVATLVRARRTNASISRISGSFEDREDKQRPLGNLPAATTQSASIRSSQDQPSF